MYQYKYRIIKAVFKIYFPLKFKKRNIYMYIKGREILDVFFNFFEGWVLNLFKISKVFKIFIHPK